MNDLITGEVLEKSIFRPHGALMTTGEIKFKKKLTREQFCMFMLKLVPSVVISEACGSANYWAGQRQLISKRAPPCSGAESD